MAIVIFISIFIVLLVTFVMEEHVGMSMAAITADNVRTSILKRIRADGRWEKLRNLQKGPDEYLKKALIISFLTGAFLFLITLNALGMYSMAFFIAGIAGTVFIAEAFINYEYKEWQQKMIEGIPGLIDFLPSFLETPGITTRAALEYTIPFIPEPLRSEFIKTLNSIKRTGDARKELMYLSARVRLPIMEAVCTRLATTWDTTISADLFSDLREEIINIQEMAAAKATTKKKGMLVLVILIGILGVVLLMGFPILNNVLDSISSGFGA